MIINIDLIFTGQNKVTKGFTRLNQDYNSSGVFKTNKIRMETVIKTKRKQFMAD